MRNPNFGKKVRRHRFEITVLKVLPGVESADRIADLPARVRLTQPENLSAPRFTVLPSQELITCLAERIATVYLLRYPEWTPSRSLSGVWEAAATSLAMLHRCHPSLPLDPELFVAVQPKRTWADPWLDLTEEESFRRYKKYVRRIVTQLRDELREEIRWSERRIRRGATVVEVLGESNGRVSAMGRYIIARRAGLDGLAERLRPEAERQHRSCPLYQYACRRFLSDDVYPTPRMTGLKPGLVIPAGFDLPSFSMN